MKKFFKILGIALVALLFVGTFVYLISKSRNKEILYQEIPVEKTDIRKTTVVTGKIEPRNEVNVKPQINGIISELYKEAGQTVQEGEVIARLKVIPDMSSLSSAESRVRLAEINLAQAQTDYEREKILFDKQLVSADEYVYEYDASGKIVSMNRLVSIGNSAFNASQYTVSYAFESGKDSFTTTDPLVKLKNGDWNVTVTVTANNGEFDPQSATFTLHVDVPMSTGVLLTIILVPCGVVLAGGAVAAILLVRRAKKKKQA